MNVSRKNILALLEDDFIDQGILSYEEMCSFGDDDIESLRLNGSFPPKAVLGPSTLSSNLTLFLLHGCASLNTPSPWV